LAAASSNAGRGHVRLFNVPDALAPPDDVKLIQGKTVDQRTAEEKARVEAYNREETDLIATADGDFPPVYAIAFTPDGRTLATGAADGMIHFFSPIDGRMTSSISAFELSSPSHEEGPPPSDSTVEFLTDVMPVLGKLGCNAGTCHGSREGQNGFQLS